MPVNHELVPDRLAIAWQDSRVGMAILGSSLLVLEAVFYAIVHA